MKKLIYVGLLFLTPLAAHAGMIFTASLNGGQEVPPNNSTASGIANLFLNDAQTRLTMKIVLSGLDLDGNQTTDTADDVLAMHIHRAPRGSNGGVVFGLIGPNSDENGDLIIDAANGIISSAWDLDEGNGTTLVAELANLFGGGLYFNVHTPAFGGGEIRGQIGVPEPGSIALFGIALLALFARKRFLPRTS